MRGRLILKKLLIIMVLVGYSTHFLKYNSRPRARPSPPMAPKKKRTPPPRKGLLILSDSGSGSSLLGELFNQHPDVFFLHEPLISVPLNEDILVLEKLTSIFSCRLKNMTIPSDANTGMMETFKDCVENNICFRNKSKSLCSSKFCDAPHRCDKCRRLTSTELSSTCLSRKFSAAGDTRLQDFRRIKSLLSKRNQTVKILHLVRDPRAMLASRREVKADVTMSQICQGTFTNAKLGLIDSPRWIKGRYKLVRYEDIAISPFSMAEKIYKFVGLKFKDWVRLWMKSSARDYTQRSEDLWKDHKIEDKNTAHSNETWMSWTKSLTNSDIEEVQRDCKEMMKLLGYEPLSANPDGAMSGSGLGALLPYNGTTISR